MGVNDEIGNGTNSKPSEAVEEKHEQHASEREPALTESAEASNETSPGLPQQIQLEKGLILPEHNKSEELIANSTISEQKQPKENINIVTDESKDVVEPATTEHKIEGSVKEKIQEPKQTSQEDTAENKEETTRVPEEKMDYAEAPTKKKQRKNRRRRPKKAQPGPPG